MSLIDLINPFYRQRVISQRAFIFFLSFILYFLLIRLSFAVLSKLIELNLIGFRLKADESIKQVEFSIRMFIIGDIITSIIEEIIYRFGLVFSIRGSIIYFFGIYLNLLFWLIPYESFNSKTVFVFFIISMALGFLIIWRFSHKYSNFLRDLWKNRFKSIFIVSILTFSILHIQNYQSTDKILAITLFPIVLIPYIIAGYYYGLVRIKFGFSFAVFAHIVYNFLIRFIDL